MTNKPAREAEARESYQREIMAKVARENLIRWLVDSIGYEWEIAKMLVT
jgi:hypothetical protein